VVPISILVNAVAGDDLVEQYGFKSVLLKHFTLVLGESSLAIGIDRASVSPAQSFESMQVSGELITPKLKGRPDVESDNTGREAN